LTLLLLLLTRIPPAALLPLPLVFAAGLVGRRLPVPRRIKRVVLEPVYVFAIALIPAVVVILLAQPAAAPIDNLYYR
jgi:hypothetical protein